MDAKPSAEGMPAAFGSGPSPQELRDAPADQGGAAPRRGRRAALARYAVLALGAAAVLGGLYLTSCYQYLLFHSLAELFSIVVACCIFVVVWNTRRLLGNSYLLFVGVAYLFVAALDLVHTLAYKGMRLLAEPEAETNLATQLWIAARYVESLSLFVATFFIGRKLKIHLVILGHVAVLEVVLLSIFAWRVFPTCYVEGEGLTAFKVVSEYVICAILVASVVQLVRHRGQFDPGVLRLVIASVAITVAEELAFTLYTDPYGPANLIGHFLKIVSFYLIYRALVQTGLVEPYRLLFRDLKQAQTELEHTVAELARSNADLEQFARVASHDLQAPLARVTDYLRLLERTSRDRLDEEAGVFLARALGGAAQMRDLIRDILAYSRLDRGDKAFEPVDCASVVRQVLEQLEGAVEESGGRLAVGDLPTVQGDGQQLAQLFRNLIDNALKFRSETVPSVEVAAERENGNWLFSVCDNGIGIPPDAQERIFAMFERLHGRSDYPGTGIGLAVCRKIVERHGGRIWVESEPGCGSTFYFTLPAAGG